MGSLAALLASAGVGVALASADGGPTTRSLPPEGAYGMMAGAG
jgi:hypothetical protein